MVFIPFIKFTINTELSAEEITDKLKTVTIPSKFIRIPYSRRTEGKYFEGKIHDRRFKIMRIPGWQRRCFFPVLLGGISERQLSITSRIRFPDLLGMTMILAFSGVLFFLSLKAFIFDGDYSPLIFGAATQFIICYLAFTIPVIVRTNKAKKYLIDLLKKEEDR